MVQVNRVDQNKKDLEFTDPSQLFTYTMPCMNSETEWQRKTVACHVKSIKGLDLRAS